MKRSRTSALAAKSRPAEDAVVVSAPGRAAWLAYCGLACGVLGPLLWIGMILLCAVLTPGYSGVSDFISELAARGSTTEQLMRIVGFGVSGGLYVFFSGVLCWRSRFELLALPGALLIGAGGAARIVAGVYNCDPGCDPNWVSAAQELHNHAAHAGYLALILAALYWGVIANRYRALKRLSPFSIGCGTWTVVFLVLLQDFPDQQGLFQRLASGALSLWVLVLALFAWRGGLATQPLRADAKSITTVNSSRAA